MKNVRIYDNQGASFDRYTAVYMDYPESNGCFMALGMSDNPSHPQGFGQHTSAQPGPHLGKRIRFADLPKACQSAIAQDLN